ncbi:MAG: hypothetical protein ACFFFB_09850 [Candidatus Heimdallarchaeota archaeon]
MDKYKNLKLFFIYFGIFFVVLIIGTIIHELGHYIVAVIFGVPAQISYAYTTYFGFLTGEQRFWFILGGPLISWLVSIIGITFIFIKYRFIQKEKTKPIGIGHSISIVATSFSIRFIFNAGWYLVNTTILGVPCNTDETQIATYLGINPDILMYGSGMIALVLIIIALYYIPRFQRYIVLFAGIIGGVLGYLFWNYWIGPIILPRL